MPARKNAASSLATTLAALNTVDQRGQLLAGLVDHDLLLRAIRHRVIRPDDLLVLDLALDNLGISKGKLKRLDASKPGLLIVEHQTQAIGEEAFLQTSDDGSAQGLPLPARVRAAGNSRVVFEMPADIDSIAYTLDEVLQACRTWPLKLNWAAQPAPPPESPPGLLHWGDVQAEVVHLSGLLKDAAITTLGAAAVTRLTRGATALGREVGGSLATNKRNTRAIFQRDVQARVDDALPGAAALPQEQQLLARAYVEIVSAGHAVAQIRPDAA